MDRRCLPTLSEQQVRDFIRKEVKDWDDDELSNARFKAFSGQKSDWERMYGFWRDLIIKVAVHFDVFVFHPSEVKDTWFCRGGLTPLCLDHVLLEMQKAGDIIQRCDLEDQMGGPVTRSLRKYVNLVGLSKFLRRMDITEDHVVLMPALKQKAAEVLRNISENHWTSSCIITFRSFQNLCGGSLKASSIMSYLTSCGKLLYLATKKIEMIEGVKISLTQERVSSITALDYDVLHLISTVETLQRQLDVIDQRWQKSKVSALASLRSGDKRAAMRHAKQLKFASESREKCCSLLNRVEEVLEVIANIESSQKVCEAIQIAGRAIEEKRVGLEEVHLCLQELEESIDMQKQVQNVLGFEDEDVEDEFKKLELELEIESSSTTLQDQDDCATTAGGEIEIEINHAGDANISKLSLVDGATSSSSSSMSAPNPMPC